MSQNKEGLVHARSVTDGPVVDRQEGLPSWAPLVRDTGLVCTDCRWRAGHSPDCPRKDEPWPLIPDDSYTATLQALRTITDEMVSVGMVAAQMESVGKPFYWSNAVRAAYQAMIEVALRNVGAPRHNGTEGTDRA